MSPPSSLGPSFSSWQQRSTFTLRERLESTGSPASDHSSEASGGRSRRARGSGLAFLTKYSAANKSWK